jgi:hypothetical protein
LAAGGRRGGWGVRGDDGGDLPGRRGSHGVLRNGGSGGEKLKRVEISYQHLLQLKRENIETSVETCHNVLQAFISVETLEHENVESQLKRVAMSYEHLLQVPRHFYANDPIGIIARSRLIVHFFLSKFRENFSL